MLAALMVVGKPNFKLRNFRGRQVSGCAVLG